MLYSNEEYFSFFIYDFDTFKLNFKQELRQVVINN